MEFENKQFDGPYEITGIELKHKDQIFEGMLYFPPERYKKPFPLIIYLHGFPQLFSLEEIIRNFNYLLDLGYAFLAFNFRGYRSSQGEISIKSHVSDAKEVITFIKKMADHGVFDLSNINMIAHDFGAYVSLLLCSKIKIVNRLLLISPILDLRKHVYGESFNKNLDYINKFLPGNIRGIEDIEKFIETTKKELSKKEFKVEKAIKTLEIKKFAVIQGDEDKITPVEEVESMLNKANIFPKIIFIKSMEHYYILDDEMEGLNNEIKAFFT